MTRAHKQQAPVETGMFDWWQGDAMPCPPHLQARLQQALGDRHYREARFLVVLGMIVTFVSLLVDAVTSPQTLGDIALVRLGSVIPIQCAALAMPRSQIAWQKFLAGLSLCVFCLSLAYASALAPSPADAFLATGIIAMLGIATPLLPFSTRGTALFLLGIVVPTSVFAFTVHRDLEFAETFTAILVLVAAGTVVLARRMRWLERRALLLNIQSDDHARELEVSNARLTELSMQDPLTNLANRRWAQIAFARDYAFAADEAPGTTALMLLDLDHFKDFNDRWGHDVGDRCLQAVAEVLRHAAGTHGGLAARFGGEEFVLLLRADGPGEARALAEEIRVGVERIEIGVDSPPHTLGCTVSIGIALHASDEKPKLPALLKRADKALYEAKSDGRNRSVLSGIAA